MKQKGFTRFPNPLLDDMINCPALNGTDLKILLHVVRKTIGFQKTEDGISISQFQKALSGVSRQTVFSSLNKLRQNHLLLEVRHGNSLKSYNVYRANENPEAWELVKKARPVKKLTLTGKGIDQKLVKKSIPTKETTTKETLTKDNALGFSPQLKQKIKQEFADNGGPPLNSEASEANFQELVKTVANKKGVINPPGYARNLAKNWFQPSSFQERPKT